MHRRTSSPDDALVRCTAGIIGFAITANFSLMPSAEHAPRLLDVFTSTAATWTIISLFTRPFFQQLAWLFLATLFFLMYAIWGSFVADNSLIIASVRLIVVLLSIPTIGLLLATQQARTSLLLGGAVGAVVVAAIAMGQKLEFYGFFFSFIPTNTSEWWGSIGRRAVGIWQHPNELTAIQAIGAAMALSLAWRPKLYIVAHLLFFLIVGLTYYATQTRAGIVEAVFIGFVVYGFQPNKQRRMRVFLISLPIFLAAILLAPDLLGERWTGTTREGLTLMGNISERLGTTLNSLFAILLHPFGLGFEGRLEHVKQINHGITATHNGFISFGLTFGLLPVVLLLVMAIKQLWADRSHFLFPTLATITLVLFTEDIIYSPSIQLPLALGILGAIQFFPNKEAAFRENDKT